MAEMLCCTVGAVSIGFSQASRSGSPSMYQLGVGLNPFPSTLRTEKQFHIKGRPSFEHVVRGPGDLMGQHS